MSKKSKIPKVLNNVTAGTIEENHLSGPVLTYRLTREEIEKMYGPVEPRPARFHNGWPTAGKPNMRHIAKQRRKDEEPDIFDEIDYTDPEWGVR